MINAIYHTLAISLILVISATPFRVCGLGPNQGLSTPSSDTPQVLVKVYSEGSSKTSCKGLFSTKI